MGLGASERFNEKTVLGLYKNGKKEVPQRIKKKKRVKNGMGGFIKKKRSQKSCK